MSLSSDEERYWASFRERSLQPGGFGGDRVRIWPALLGAQPLSDPPPYSEVDTIVDENGRQQGKDELVEDPHADERQIKLDTDRSFVLYPGESGTMPTRDTLQHELHGLLVSLFRKRRSLHYFQGFHDIITVIFLTLPRPLHLACAEKMALHRVRDAMGVGLEPVLGLLRVLRNLIRLADPAYAKLLETISPLPYHALSHLLTLFSHDVPTLPLIQHVWDFLLSREPIAVVWLAAALILHRKPSVHLLAEQDEEGMIHSLLGGIPELVDAEGQLCDTGHNESADIEADRATPQETDATGETLTRDEDELDRSAAMSNMAQSSDTFQTDSPDPSTPTTPLLKAAEQVGADGPQHHSTLELAAATPLPESRPVSPTHVSPTASPGPSSAAQSSVSLPLETTSTDHHSPSCSTSDHAPLRSRSSSSPTRHSSAPPSKAASRPTSRFMKSVWSKPRTKPPSLPLTDLLRQADGLLAAYPPSHPSLHVTEILGPDSAMRTWRPLPISTKARETIPEKLPYNCTDDYLETLVNSSHIVIPSPPPSPTLGFGRHPVKKSKVSPKALSRALLDPRRIGLRLGALTPAERRMLFMGALLVVGAAMALKAGKVPCMGSIVKTSGGDGLKRLWNGKWTLISSVVAAWGRGLP